MNENSVFKRTAKDSVFTHMFQDRKYVLELYYALHPEARNVTEDMIDIVTLENIMVNNIYNDLGFTVGDQLVILAEAQSTWSVNILIRALLYLAQTYHDYIRGKELNIYGTKRIDIPKPEIYVVYTGDKRIEKDVYSLSEVFFGNRVTDLEVKVHVLTDGKGDDIIHQYVAFTKIFDEQVRLHGQTKESIAETIRICKDQNILSNYISEHEREVQNIMITLFDSQEIIDAYGREKVAEGDMNRAKETAYRLQQKGMPLKDIAEIVDANIVTVQQWLTESAESNEAIAN